MIRRYIKAAALHREDKLKIVFLVDRCKLKSKTHQKVAACCIWHSVLDRRRFFSDCGAERNGRRDKSSVGGKETQPQ